MDTNSKDQHMEIFECDDDEIIYKEDTSKVLKGIQIAFAEFLGTTILIFISCTSCTWGLYLKSVSNLHTSFASGLAVMTVIQQFGHISGAHVNPAVTLCGLIMGQLEWLTVPIYVVSQMLGSLTGYALVMATTPAQHLNVTGGHCVTAPHPDLGGGQALVIEALATLIMCLAICASWDPQNSSKLDSIALRIGLLVVALNLGIGAYTGASMNPTRSLGPAVWNGNLEKHWVYWIGPIIGGVAAGIFYRKIFLKS